MIPVNWIPIGEPVVVTNLKKESVTFLSFYDLGDPRTRFFYCEEIDAIIEPMEPAWGPRFGIIVSGERVMPNTRNVEDAAYRALSHARPSKGLFDGW